MIEDEENIYVEERDDGIVLLVIFVNIKENLKESCF